ncbi:tungsten formylmethanofuran dehydrogenase [Acidisphaera sp. S103]|uniref:tungsten formylmethanofuran dehydrogenase n=1 Tax=Acidisphaera sp. S103 TaxID=1747223 RepID=UPI00131E9854|nr:tungsten formylmethanofuran dehydrogenase [Acidisphaera sp. S103]
MTEATQTGGAEASVNGVAVSRAEAVRAAAALLAGSRSSVVAGMGTDVAGARASIRLAERIGASIDHMDAEAVFANLDVMRRAGWIVTTPLQARARADTVLLVGDGLFQAWPEMTERLGLNLPPTLAGGTRRVFHLCPGTTATGVASVRVVAGLSAVLPTLAALRALAAGRATALHDAAAAPLCELADALSQAKFGVAIWSAGSVDTLAIELLCGLIDDLNKRTRFTGLPLVPSNGAEGVAQTSAWTTGFPMRSGFAGAEPLHDPWRFDAKRLIDSGEADSALWISAFSRFAPPWDNAVPTVALVPAGTVFRSPPAVVLEVGRPGHDHDTMLFDQGLGGIAFAAAGTPTTIPSVADTMAAITSALPSC